MFGRYGNDLTGGETTKKENDNGSFTLFLSPDFGGMRQDRQLGRQRGSRDESD